MNRPSALLATIAILLGAAGCPTADDDDDVAGSLIDLEGTVIDRTLDDAPVSDAWILVDTGDELISARSASDWTFLIPAVPSATGITLTVAGEDRRATTYLDRILDDEDLPLELPCEYRDSTYYDVPIVVVSGTFTGAPVGTYVYFSGEGVLSYDYFYVESTDPTEFQFEAQIPADEEEYFFTGLAFDGQTGAAMGAAAVTMEVEAQVDVEVEFVYDEPTTLTISASQPLLNGAPLTTLDPTYTSSLGMVYAGEGYGSFVGWTMDWDATDDGFDLYASYVPIEDHDAYVTVYLAEDLTSTAEGFSYALVPFEPGATELDVEMMDSPDIGDASSFGDGTTLSWDPVDGATDYTLYAIDDGELVWWFLADEPSFTFPRFPDGFDASIILPDGDATWTARATEVVEDAEGEADLTQGYRITETPGGAIEI